MQSILLALLVGCQPVLPTTGPDEVEMNDPYDPDDVGLKEVNPADLKAATIRIAPNHLANADFTFEEYAPALRRYLEEYWTNATFRIEIAGKDHTAVGEIVSIVAPGGPDDLEAFHEELIDAVGDHFFDHYPGGLR